MFDLFKPRWQHRNWEIRLKAVEKLTDQELLARIIENDSNHDVCQAAVKKLTDQKLLAKIAENDSSIVLREEAVKKLTDQKLLAKIAENDSSHYVRRSAAAMITDETIDETCARASAEMEQGRYKEAWTILHGLWKVIQYKEQPKIRALYAELLRKGQAKDLLNGKSQSIENTGYTLTVVVLPDGRQALSGSSGRGGRSDTLMLWNLATLECVRAFEGHTDGVSSVAVLPDGRQALSGSWDHTLRLWDLDTGECVRTFEGHTDRVSTVAVLPDGRQALSGSNDLTLKLWDLATGECERTLEGHRGRVTAMVLTSDGRRALTGSDWGNLRLWDLATGKCVLAISGHSQALKTLILLHDDEQAVSAGQHTFRLWDLATGLCISKPWLWHEIMCVAVLPDGRQALSGSRDGVLRLWDLATGECVHTIGGHQRKVHSVAVLPDGRQALSGGDDDTLKLWNLETGECVSTLEGYSGISDMTLLPDGRVISIFYSPSTGNNALVLSNLIWNLEFENIGKRIEPAEESKQSVAETCDRVSAEIEQGRFKQAWAILHDAWKAICFKEEPKFHALYTELFKKGQTKELLKAGRRAELVGHTDYVSSVAALPDGRHALSGSSDSTLKLWDLASGECVRTFEGHVAGVSSMAVLPDGRQALSGSEDHTLKLWDLATGECLRTLEGSSGFDAIAVLPDGRRILTGDSNYKLKLWDLATGECLRTLEEHVGVDSVAVLPNGRQLLYGAHARGESWLRIRSLDADYGDGDFGSDYMLYSDICAVAVLPDGRHALSGSRDHTIKVWDLSNLSCVHTLDGLPEEVNVLAVLPDGQAISTGMNHTLFIWSLIWDLEFNL